MRCAQNIDKVGVFLKDIGDKYTKDSSIKAWGFDTNTEVYKDLFFDATGKELYAGQDINMKDLKKFDSSVKGFISDLQGDGFFNLNNAMVKHLFVGGAKAGKSPISKKFRSDLININNYKQRHHQRLHGYYQDMMTHFKKAIMSYDLNINSRKAFNELTTKEQDYVMNSLNNKEDNPTLIKDLDVLLGSDGFLQNEGKIFQDFIDVVTTGSAKYISEKYKEPTLTSKGKGEYNDHLMNAVNSWKEIQTISKKILIDSVGSLKNVVSRKRADTEGTKKLLEEYTKIENQLKGYKDNYIPHYILELVGKSMEIREALHSKDAMPEAELESFFLRQAESAAKINDQLLDRLKKPGREESEYFSRNPQLYAHKYIADVVRFNFSTKLDEKLLDAMDGLTEAFSKNTNTADIETTARAVEKLIGDMHGTAINGVAMSDAAKNIVRIATSIGFASKLGFSTRGALRNATQVLQEFTYFGAKGLREAGKFYEQGDMKDLMEIELARHGLKFEDPSKFTEGAILQKDLSDIGIDIQDGHIYYSDKKTILDKGADLASKTAQASASLIPILNMKTIENWNRRHTFKTSFAIGYNQLQGEYREMRTLNRDTQSERYEYLKNRRLKQAGKFAAKMVSEIHYEYSPWEKAQVLTTPVGAVLGQFQHFGLSFLNFQAQILKKAGKDLAAGDYLGENAWRMYRLFTMYSIASAIGWAANLDFSNIFNNDTVEKVKDLKSAFFGDPDEKDEAFYGKGPLIGLAGAVPLSDLMTLVNIGAAKGYYDLSFDEDNMVTWLAGVRDYSNKTDTQLNYELARTFSTSIGRFAYKTYPAFKNSGLVQAIMMESGLFPTKETKTGHDWIFGTDLSKGKKQIKYEESLQQGTTKQKLKLLEKSRRAALHSLSNI